MSRQARTRAGHGLAAIALWLLAGLSRSGGALAAPPLIDLATEPLGADCFPAPGRIGTSSAVAAASGGSHVYQASAGPGRWSGGLTRVALTVDSAGVPAVQGPAWDAAALLDALPDPARTRRIYTSKTEHGTQATMPFEWDQLSAAQRTALNRPPPPARAVPDGLGQQRLAYLRGDRSQEGRLFRRRDSLLGDAVHSLPVHAGPPSPEGQGEGYAAHVAAHSARRAAVYLGANDGMLHAFDAESGAELFAYVPAALLPELNQLAAPGYVHRAYVDGPASVAEAQLGGAWKTVLVSAMGAGAQGLFALDVTGPADFGAGGGALWEFTGRDDAAMGHVTGLPHIVRVRLRAGSSGYRYFALATSGVNSAAPDGDADAGGSPAIFLLALDKPPGEAWRLNRNYYRLHIPAGEPGRPNALGAPVLVKDADGALRYAYAGDLQGNLWRFSFTGGPPWRSAAEGPVFVARDAHGARQPITAQPAVVNGPEGGLLLLFGTGRLFGRADRDPSRYAGQSFYAVLDASAVPGTSGRGDGGGTGGAAPGWPLGRAGLAQRELDGAPGGATLTVRGRVFSYGAAGGFQGWYIDYLHGAEGERSITGPVVADGTVYFNTTLTGATACAPISSRSYALAALAGLPADGGGWARPGEASGTLVADHVPAPPVPVVVEAVRTPAQGNGRIVLSRRVAVVNFGARAAGALPSGRSKSVVAAGRIGWREVGNWRELHQAARAREGRP